MAGTTTFWQAFTGALMATLAAGSAAAQTCSTTSLPYALANGTTADATQVMADLNCAALYSLAHASGNVGIGTTTPAEPLDVNGVIRSNSEIISYLGNGPGQFRLIGGNYGAFWRNDGTQTALLFTASGNQYGTWNALRPLIVNDVTGDVTIGGAFLQQSTGYVGVGTSAPSQTFYVNGQAGGSMAWSSPSDARLKKNIREVGDALGVIEQLRGVRFEWRDPSEREVGRELTLPRGQPELGFIAQEVVKVAPEAVSAPKDPKTEAYSLKETELIPLLVEAIKQQQSEIKELQTTVAELRTRQTPK